MEKIHEFVIKVKFNKPCTKTFALHQIKDALYETVYNTDIFNWDKTAPTEMVISIIKEKIA